MNHHGLAEDLLRRALRHGADGADLIVGEGTEFSVTVRKGEIETLKDAGSKALGLRVFVGRRTASTYTSDFSPPALDAMVQEAVAMARATGEDPAAGLPDEMIPAEAIDLGLHDPSVAALPPEERIERARRRRGGGPAPSPGSRTRRARRGAPARARCSWPTPAASWAAIARPPPRSP